MRKFMWMMLLSVSSVLAIYLAGEWFNTLLPE
jgi:hypothetical protein